MESLQILAGALGLSFASGVNLYATVLIVGVAARFGWLPALSSELEILAHPVVLTVAGVLYLIEFFADKIPLLNSLWDGFHTFIRPLGAVFLALGAAEQLGPLGQTLVAILGGSVALGSHSTKAGLRLLANTAAPEPVTHSAISAAEDLGVLGLLVLGFTYPWAAALVLAGLLLGMAFLTPLIFRVLRFLWVSILGSVFLRVRALSYPPGWLEERLSRTAPDARWKVYRAFARAVRGAPRLGSGYAAVSSEGVWFAREGLFRKTFACIARGGEWDVERGALADTIVGLSSGGAASRIVLAKHWGHALYEDWGPAVAKAAPAVP